MMIKAILGNEKGDSFLILITTLNMLLLAFFIVLNSIAVRDDRKERKALDSLLGTLGVLTSGVSPGHSTETKTFPKSVEMARLDENLLEVLRRVEQFALDAKLESDLSLQFGKKGVIVQLTNRIAFEEGRAALRPDAKKLLSEIGVLFANTLGSINVIGHTSPGEHEKGSFPDDWTLSFARAGVAARFFINSSGVKPARITTAGYGSTRPRTSGETEQKRILNDRLELVLDRTKI